MVRTIPQVTVPLETRREVLRKMGYDESGIKQTMAVQAALTKRKANEQVAIQMKKQLNSGLITAGVYQQAIDRMKKETPDMAIAA